MSPEEVAKALSFGCRRLVEEEMRTAACQQWVVGGCSVGHFWLVISWGQWVGGAFLGLLVISWGVTWFRSFSCLFFLGGLVSWFLVAACCGKWKVPVVGI